MANRISVNEQSSNAPRFSLAGYVIVATELQNGGIYENAVCIVVEHTAERAVGLMLNRTAYFDPDLMPKLKLPEGQKHSKVYFGGPIDGPIVALHDNESLAEGGNNLGVYLASQEKNLVALTKSESGQSKFYVGHAIWGPKQLDAQVIEGGWLVLPALPEIVFSEDNVMRPIALRMVGNELLKSVTGLPVGQINYLLN